MMLDQHVSDGLKKVLYVCRKYLGLLKHCIGCIKQYTICELVWINTNSLNLHTRYK